MRKMMKMMTGNKMASLMGKMPGMRMPGKR
jgi:hypothetical protein